MSETPSLVEQVKAAMKAAMKAREKQTLSTIRLIQADFKRIEVDERIEIDDARAIAIMDKMVKQRRDSAKQYRDADRPELADQEDAEIVVIQTFLPEQLSAADIDALIDEALAGIEATGMAAMGQLMGKLKPNFRGAPTWVKSRNASRPNSAPESPDRPPHLPRLHHTRRITYAHITHVRVTRGPSKRSTSRTACPPHGGGPHCSLAETHSSAPLVTTAQVTTTPDDRHCGTTFASFFRRPA